MTGTDMRDAYEAWTEHRYFAYRGCAPDADDPRRAAGNPELSLDAWLGEDRDGAEPAKERAAREAAAIEVCLNCPVMVQCDAYASSVTPRGALAEPVGIRGGRRALERHRAFIATRHEVVGAASDDALRTEQKLGVLRALAVHRTPEAVAAAAGMDVRTANWQRSRLTTQLGLPASASREEVLGAAVGRGLLDAAEVSPPPSRLPSLRRDRFSDVKGQLALWEAELADADLIQLADVHPLPVAPVFPESASPLEAAA